MKSLLCACLIATAVFWSWPEGGKACTTFCVDTPTGPLVAKNFDWSTGDGWVVLNERGRARTLLFPSVADSADSAWQAKYASLSLTTIGPGFPISGMNEAGLVIESLVDQSEAPTAKVAQGVPTGLEWVQRGLDTSASVKELVQLAERTGLSQLAIALHFFACDRSGECAVIETQSGRVRTTLGRGLTVEALANRPYSADLADAHPSWLKARLGKTKPSSSSRFAIAAKAAGSKGMSLTTALQSLEQAAVSGLTQWQLVWDLGHAQVHLRRPRHAPDVTTLRLADFPSCQDAPRVIRLDKVLGASRAWSDADAALAEAAVIAQLGGPSPRASDGGKTPMASLAERIALATQATRCSSNK